jgi:hypothetical protein
MGIVKIRKSRASQKIFLISKKVQDSGNRTSDFFTAMPGLCRQGILYLCEYNGLHASIPFILW